MTKREFYTAVINGEVNEELVAFAEAEIEKLDAENARNAAKRAEKAKENEPYFEKILALISADPVVASEVAAQLEVSTSKASSLLRTMVKDGKIAEYPEKIKSGKSKVNGYVAI